MKIYLIFFAMIFFLNFVSAAHYVVGYVEDALDGELANGKVVTLWNPANGQGDNVTDTIGPTGNSGQNNIYMIDCEMLTATCSVGDILSLKVFENGNQYVSNIKNVTITPGGYDAVENLTLNSLLKITNLTIEDGLSFPFDEIDLNPATTTKIICEGIITAADNENSIRNVSAKFFDSSEANYESEDDNNYHYSNNSCSLNLSYGSSKEIKAFCIFQVEYYANSGNWTCSIQAIDNNSVSVKGTDTTNINPLLALDVDSPIDFGRVNSLKTSKEIVINITNYGNTKINLTLSGFAKTELDGKAMDCSNSENSSIALFYEKYNLTSSTEGNLTFSEFEKTYTNITNNSKTKELNLNYRQNDLINEAITKSYWRIYVPSGVSGNCSGNLLFGATQGPIN